MESMKRLKNQITITAICAIVLGLLILFMPDIALITITQILAIVILVLGVMRLASYFKNSSTSGYNGDLSIGILMVIAALFCFFKAGTVVTFITILLGFGIILEGIAKCQTAAELKRASFAHWGYLMLVAAINIILGVIVLLNPFAAGTALMIFAAIGMIFGGITDLVTIYLMKKNL